MKLPKFLYSNCPWCGKPILFAAFTLYRSGFAICKNCDKRYTIKRFPSALFKTFLFLVILAWVTNYFQLGRIIKNSSYHKPLEILLGLGILTIAFVLVQVWTKIDKWTK